MSALKLYVNCPENEKAQAADQRQLSQSNMQEELKEVIRVLQLVSSDWTRALCNLIGDLNYILGSL